MSIRNGRALRLFAALSLVGLLHASAFGQGGGPKRAVDPIAPSLPAPVVAALQGGKYDEALAGVDRLIGEAKDLPLKSYLALIRGTIERLSGKADAARTTWVAALAADPKGLWAPKIRFELAGVELAAGKPARAEELTRVEAERLLDGDRKDRLAGVYYTFARRLLKPDDPITRPDPVGARVLLEQARNLAKGPSLIAELRLEMARASALAGNHAQAIVDYQDYLKEPKATDRPAALYGIGEAEYFQGLFPPARLTWTDLAAELEKPPLRDRPDAAAVRAKALYQVAMTYRIPMPPDPTQLELGVAALRRYLAAYPAHPWSVRASYQIGQAYLHLRRTEPALAAFKDFLAGKDYRAETDDARRELAELTMKATYDIAGILKGQQKFDEAIAALQGYLAKFPNGPQSAQAQREILNVKLLIASDSLRREKYAEAREAWTAFVAQYPLDARLPQILFQVGESFLAEKKPDEAIKGWDVLLSKFPGSQPAAQAQFLIASIYEADKGDPAQAIERFRKVTVQPWQAQAQARIAVMESRELTVVTPRTFRSGETPHLKVTTRNLETLTFSAYKLNAEAYFRKKQALSRVESLDIGLVAPDAEWTVPVASYARYKPVETTYDLRVKAPGVWVVKVTDEKHLQATTLVLGSDIDAVVKASRDQLLVFAQDMKTGKGRPKARVLVADDTGVILDKPTGDDGVLLASWEKPRENSSSLRYLVLDGADAAGTALSLQGSVSQGLAPRAYIYTDRPAYRPGQRVALRGVVREVKDGQYSNPAAAVYRLDVLDSRGRLLIDRPVTLTAFGTFHDEIALDSGAALGSYRVRLFQPGKSEFAGAFEVQAYQLEKVDLTFDLPKTVYVRGETVAADVIARYQYGAPLANRPIQVSLPDGRTLKGLTDGAGKFHVEFATSGFAEEQTLQLIAALPRDNVSVVAAVALAIRALKIDVATTRDTYLDGETFSLKIDTADALGKPTGREVSVAILKRISQGGLVSEREVSRSTVSTDPKTGEARAQLQVIDPDGGTHVVRVSATDRLGNVIVADRVLMISGKADETKLRLLADRVAFKVGETAAVRLHSRLPAGPALVAWEADRIIQYRIVDLKEGDNPLTWAVEGPQFPNFTLTAARMSGSRFDEARLDVRVERDLRVTLTPRRPAVGPGEEVEVDVTAADQLGRPVAAELSVALVDRSLLRLFADTMPPIGPYFYSQSRTGSFTTCASNIFVYSPHTTPVSEALVQEVERNLALNDDDKKLDEARKKALNFGYLGDKPAMPAEMAPANSFPSAYAVNTPPPAPGAMGGMGGGRMGRGRKDAALRGGIEEEEVAKLETKPGAKAKSPVGLRRSKSNVPREMALIDAEDSHERFAETAYWNPSVVTGPDGKATIKVKAPSSLSEYRFTARGVTGSDTLVGQTTADLVVRKDFFVDLKAPAALTQGDKPRLIAEVHHTGIVGPAELSLTIYSGGKQDVHPRKVAWKADGIDEVAFEPFEVPEGESVRLTLKAQAGAKSDELTIEVPIRPWGVQAFASASGTSSDDATVFVGLPPGRAYDNPEMLITIAPSLKRMLIELALGREYAPTPYSSDRGLPCPVLPLSIADRASELIACAAALDYLRWTKADAAPEAQRLSARIRALTAELISLQEEDGGWPWVASGPGHGQAKSDRMTSALAARAFAAAWGQAMMTDPAAFDRAVNYLRGPASRADGNDLEMRAMFQHALAAMKRGDFNAANSLNRVRQSLPDAALAELALTFADLEHASLSGEILDLLSARARVENVGPGVKPRTFWQGEGQHWNRGPAETTALVALAYARVRPQAKELAGAAEWLLAHRVANGWQPPKAKGPAIAALARYYGQSRAADDRYSLAVTVNDAEVYRADITGAAEGKGVLVPRKILKLGDRNRVRFHVEGRGTFGYSVSLTGFARDFGPEQDHAGKSFVVDSREYLPAEPELDGKALPTGFGAAINPKTFTNKVTQVGLGGRARVEIGTWADDGNRPAWERDFLVVEETLPAGTTLIEGSLQSQAINHTLADGVLTLYFAPGTHPGSIRYDVFGYVPGQYRALPTRIRSAYEPGRQQLGPAGSLRVLPAGETPNDPYRATPDELLARGKAHYEAGRLAEAAAPLEELFGAYSLRDDVARDAARMLLTIHIKDYQPRKVVQDFEILKEKAPDLMISFDEVAVAARAYRDIGEHERAYLVWRAIIEASYLEDAQVGENLRRRGKTLDAVAYLLELWRDYPDTASIETDLFGISQLLAVSAGKAISDPTLRHELAAAGLTRSDLILQAIRLDQTFLALSPRNPLADEVSLALVGNFLELEDFTAVVRLAERFAAAYPGSKFLDSFQYSEALGRFHLGEYDRAIDVANRIAKAIYKDPNGADQPSPNKWEATYILGQIHDARRQPAQAVAYYKLVADRFTDAASAVKGLTRKDLKLPEVSLVRPGVKVADVNPRPAALPIGLVRDAGAPRVTDKPTVSLDYRNIPEADVKVYPFDLMRLYLTRRNLDAIAGIDLAGITPLFETTIKLGEGLDFDDKVKSIDLPLPKEGAYLVMIRGENLYTSGIVLVSPLELEVLEEPEASRVRVTVRDARTKAPVPKVSVKVIGSNNPLFLSGRTDLRGVFVAEGVSGQVTAVARRDAAQYAFYRGTTPVGALAAANEPAAQHAKPGQDNGNFDLGKNVKQLNNDNQMLQLDRLQNRFLNPRSGINPAEAK